MSIQDYILKQRRLAKQNGFLLDINGRRKEFREVNMIGASSPELFPEKDKVITMTMEYRPPFKVKLTYFKESGKYYSEGEYETQCLQMYDIFKEARLMLESGKRPGLVDGWDFPFVLVEVPDHPHAHPALMHIKEKKCVPFNHESTMSGSPNILNVFSRAWSLVYATDRPDRYFDFNGYRVTIEKK